LVASDDRASFAAPGFGRSRRHELDAGVGCIGDDCEHFAPRHRLEQRKIVDRLKACEARVLPDGVGVEVAHARNLLFLV
jgi:hypothetical protein